MLQDRISREDVEQLLKLSLLNEPGHSKHSEQLLRRLTACKPASVAVCRSYHDALLFMYVHACNKKIQALAEKGLIQLKDHVVSVMNSSRRHEQLSLSGSGIAGSLLTCQFSFAITQWLVERFPGSVNLHSASGDADAGGAILHRLFPRVEYYYTTQGKMTLLKRIGSVTGKDRSLHKLVHTFRQRITDESLREILFDALQVFTSWKLDDPVFNRSFIKGIPLPVFYHKKILKQVNLPVLLARPLPQQVSLTPQQSTRLLDVAKASLAFYSRETEPITLASPNEVKLFSFGRGLAIALFGIKPPRRLSLESYIGYMVFKNNVPVAYGGGWIFADRCKIGLNIYPPFRKGESALLFAEVLRLYQRLYHVQRFVVKPYQFGKGNREGLQSAAFWFYYKLGFRPQDRNIASLAEAEYKSGRRSGTGLLKQFTGSNLELSLNPLLPEDMDPELISRMITHMILKKFNGDRMLALEKCSSILRNQLRVKDTSAYEPHFSEFSLLTGLVPGMEAWPAAEKIKLARLLKAKANSDDAYIGQLQKCKKLLTGIYEVFQKQ